MPQLSPPEAVPPENDHLSPMLLNSKAAAWPQHSKAPFGAP